ncbi:seizure protein 6 isoform X1, partial [Clarias magur]
MSASLNEKYDKIVRPRIDLIDSLRALGVEKDLALPAIAVIGDQSSGKSSVLEALSGVALPRGSGVVTRCPLELKMKKSRNEDLWHGKINYKDYEGEIKNPAEVEKIIRKAQNEIAGALGISDELISLEVTSPNVPDVTLIDLPGIVRVSVKGQPEDIGEQSKSLIRKYITNQDTILLVVVPCNVDIATTEALKMAQEVDPYGDRTLGILTKPDLVDKGMEDAVLSIINNETIYLSKGYMIVRCRGQQEIKENISLHEAVRKEKDFFTKHPYFSVLYNERKATIHNLADRLTHELVLHIEESLPQLKEQIQSKLAETQEELNRYGSGPPSDPEQRIIFLTDKITAFNQDAISLTAGEELKSVPLINIFSRMRREFADWKTDLEKSEVKSFVLSCNFPERPAYGDVTVSSLHAEGEAYFYCFTGYKLQGPSTLTCLNATTPYWNGKEPRCLAACGGMMKNATLGPIVSPGFPSNYSNNLTCHWVLEAPEGQRLHVHFEKVALAEDDDRLLIKNGNNIDSSTLYDSYEVEYLPNEGIVSTSTFLFIEFTTDGSGTNTGAAIRYEAFAPGHCYEPFVKYGNFTSSDTSYAVGAVVEFSCDPGYTLEQGSIIIECMDSRNPQWNETEPACRAVCSGEITDSAGVVLSPNWPEAYDKGQDCIWGIHVEEDKRIMLDIQV